LSSTPTDELTALLVELQQLERELVEQRYVRRSDGRERTLQVLGRLAELGTPEGLIGRSAQEFGTNSDFDLVLISGYAAAALTPLVCWSTEGERRAQTILSELARRPLSLSYPLVEHEVIQRRRAQVVHAGKEGPRASPNLAAVCAWQSYVVAPIVLEGDVAGLLHAARIQQPGDADEIDLEVAALFASGFAGAFERATLRAQLRRQKSNLQSAARWISAHVDELSAGDMFSPATSPTTGPDPLELLTPRELEVIRLISQGMSNREIGEALVLGDGTVKYHVKNILRKLRAHSRTEAITIYSRARISEQ
jgi:DNA-binding CsgD family transcriptional regulator/GAF domain-containing protein